MIVTPSMMSFALACAASIATVGFLAQEQRGQHHSQLGLEQPSGLFTGSEATPSSSNSKSPAIIFSVLHAVVASAVSLVLDVIVIEFTVLADVKQRRPAPLEVKSIHGGSCAATHAESSNGAWAHPEVDFLIGEVVVLAWFVGGGAGTICICSC